MALFGLDWNNMYVIRIHVACTLKPVIASIVDLD